MRISGSGFRVEDLRFRLMVWGNPKPVRVFGLQGISFFSLGLCAMWILGGSRSLVSKGFGFRAEGLVCRI